MKVKGFKAAALAAGLRYKKRFDLGLIAADECCDWVGVFTKNICPAAPVLWSSTKAVLGKGRAFLANAGQANAQTGPEGERVCHLSAYGLAEILKCSPDEIMLASTGIIGQPINADRLTQALPELVKALRPDGFNDFAEAIMTTDTARKTAEATLNLDGREINIWGCAKGSGMIAPNMATMLGFIVTDAPVPAKVMKKILAEGADLTFNRVTIDGDTSTNDSLMMMASGAAGGLAIDEQAPDFKFFQGAVWDLMADLARQIAYDAEGATKLVKVIVKGAKTSDEAAKAARTVSESPLVKTAFFGCDANWGRICAALGRSGAIFDPYRVDIDIEDVAWIRNGIDNGQDEKAAEIMKRREYDLTINLNAGSAEYFMLTCDLSHEYININGSYRS